MTGLGHSSLDVLLYCFVETPDWSVELRERHRLLVDYTQCHTARQVDYCLYFIGTSMR